MNGKRCDVLIDEFYYQDTFSNLEVWADDGYKSIILGIEGVTAVYQDAIQKTRYSVFVDPRYDRNWVKAEIEAQIKISVK